MPEFSEYPKYKYKEGESPRVVLTHNEEVELGESWFDKPDMTNHSVDLRKAAMSAHPPGYSPKEYPKWRYAREIPGGKIVNSEEEELALFDAYPEIEWYDKPDYTDHGDETTDTTSNRLFVSASAPQPNALSGDRTVFAPVPEMQQGKAAQRSSSILEQKEGDDFKEETDDKTDDSGKSDGDDNNEDGEGNARVGVVKGQPQNNFDQANGVNPDDASDADKATGTDKKTPGDTAPVGENFSGPTGRVSEPPETEKQTAQEQQKPPETDKPAAKKTSGKKRDANDLL